MPSEPESRFYPRVVALATAAVLGPVIVALVLALLRFAEESRQPLVTIAGADS